MNDKPSDAVQAIDRAFYELTVRERNYERARSDRLERERDEALAEVEKLRAALAESCEDNRSVAYAEPGRTATCPLLGPAISPVTCPNCDADADGFTDETNYLERIRCSSCGYEEHR